jgi:hypothetical protein
MRQFGSLSKNCRSGTAFATQKVFNFAPMLLNLRELFPRGSTVYLGPHRVHPPVFALILVGALAFLAGPTQVRADCVTVTGSVRPAGLVTADGMSWGGAQFEVGSCACAGNDATEDHNVIANQKISHPALFGILPSPSQGGGMSGNSTGPNSGSSSPPAAGLSSPALQQPQMAGMLCLADRAFLPPPLVRSIFHPPRLS